MIDSIFANISALVGIVLINSVVLINSRANAVGWLRSSSIGVRYIAWLSFVFLIVLNGNQLISGNILFPLVTIAGIATVLLYGRQLTATDRQEVLQDGLSLFSVQFISIFLVFFVFQSHRYWLLEAHNHDSLFYYYGANWANDSRLFVGSEAVRAKWGFDTWIGFDRSLYRGGTYTLAAWIQYFSPRITGNSLYLLALYSSTMAWYAVRLLTKPIHTKNSALICSLLSMVVASATGLMGALANSNLATLMGGASLIIVLALALKSDIKPGVRYALMAAWCAICAHFYGESVFYAGLFIFLVYMFEVLKNIKNINFIGEFRLILLVLLIVLCLGNVPVIQSISSLFFLSEIANKGGDWFSWYLHNTQFFWVGSFVAGLLMGNGVSVLLVVIASGLTLVSVAYMLFRRQTRIGTLALIVASLLAVSYIKGTSYQYGEHKILHLLGPAWTFLIVIATIQSFYFFGKLNLSNWKINVAKTTSIMVLICLIVIASSFLSRIVSMLNQHRGIHSLDFGLETLVSFVRPDDTVLIDDAEWVGVERYLKTHYIAFELKHQGAKVVMPNLLSNSLRGGYLRRNLNDTLRNVHKVDWVVKGKAHQVKEGIVEPYATLIWQNNDFSLYRIDKEPVLALGNGWYDCEQSFCWTMDSFDIETYVPSDAAQYELFMDFSAFSPDQKGLVTVKSNTGKVLANIDSSRNHAIIKLERGWSKLLFNSSLQVKSPKQIGMSEDSRELFISIKQLKIKKTDE